MRPPTMWLPLASLPSPICEDGAVRCGRVRVKSHTVLAQRNVLPDRYLLGRWVSSSLQARSNEGDAVGVLAVDDMRRACSRVPVRYNCNTLLVRSEQPSVGGLQYKVITCSLD